MRNIRRTRGPYRVGATVKRGLGATFGVALCCLAHSQTTEVLSVQPATIKDGAVELYGIVRGIHDRTFEDASVLGVQVTAADSDASTILRLEAGGEPCPNCTTTHYFLLREPSEESPEVLTRAVPGPLTYLHIDSKEYMVWRVNLSWTDDAQPQLERATLMQTGFAPPIFKRRIRIRFDAPLEPGACHGRDCRNGAAGTRRKRNVSPSSAMRPPFEHTPRHSGRDDRYRGERMHAGRSQFLLRANAKSACLVPKVALVSLAGERP